MKNINQNDCDRIAYKLNTRPRKRLGYKTPYEVYYRTASPLHFAFEPKAILYIDSENLLENILQVLNIYNRQYFL